MRSRTQRSRSGRIHTRKRRSESSERGKGQQKRSRTKNLSETGGSARRSLQPQAGTSNADGVPPILNTLVEAFQKLAKRSKKGASSDSRSSTDRSKSPEDPKGEQPSFSVSASAYFKSKLHELYVPEEMEGEIWKDKCVDFNEIL